MKDDFDTLGPDAALQSVGNGTGELTQDWRSHISYTHLKCKILYLNRYTLLHFPLLDAERVLDELHLLFSPLAPKHDFPSLPLKLRRALK